MLLNFLLKIPDVVWAAVIASLLTLGGVFLTNRGSYKRLIKQLAHDSSQRDRDRNMELRRQVYLEAAEAITSNHNILTKIGNLGISDYELSSQFAISTAAISKVYVIGSSATVKAVSELSLALSTKYLQLFSKRLPLMQRKYAIDLQNDLLGKSSAERDLMVQLMKEANLQGIHDEKYWSTLKRNFEFEQEQSKKFSDERDQLMKQNNKEVIELSKECFLASKEVGEYFAPAISAVREEMDIPFDEETYRKTIEKSWEESKRSFDEFLNKITGKSG